MGCGPARPFRHARCATPNPHKHHAREAASLGMAIPREVARESKNISTLHWYELTRVILTVSGGILQTGKLRVT